MMCHNRLYVHFQYLEIKKILDSNKINEVEVTGAISSNNAHKVELVFCICIQLWGRPY